MESVPHSWLLKSLPVFLLAPAVVAQNAAEVFSKAPPDVDDALRARITKFYQEQVDGHPRLAEAIVADDSKDFFYSMAKPKFVSFEIRDIKYSDNFTKAKVMMVMEMYVPIAFFGSKPMKVPGTTLWKLEKGQWCWYIDPDMMNTTPFGKMKSSTAPGSSNSPAAQPDLTNIPTPESLSKQVRADKVRATLRFRTPSSDKITIHNGMPGAVRIELRHADVRGLEIKADRTEIPAGQDAVVSFHYQPGSGRPPHTLFVDAAVEPLNTVLNLLVVFN